MHMMVLEHIPPWEELIHKMYVLINHLICDVYRLKSLLIACTYASVQLCWFYIAQFQDHVHKSCDHHVTGITVGVVWYP